jgi:hypothetical protein
MKDQTPNEKADVSLGQVENTVHPQPTADPLDPLNWPRLQKNTILGIVMLKYVRPPAVAWAIVHTNKCTIDISSSRTSPPQPFPRFPKYSLSLLSVMLR